MAPVNNPVQHMMALGNEAAWFDRVLGSTTWVNISGTCYSLITIKKGCTIWLHGGHTRPNVCFPLIHQQSHCSSELLTRSFCARPCDGAQQRAEQTRVLSSSTSLLWSPESLQSMGSKPSAKAWASRKCWLGETRNWAHATKIESFSEMEKIIERTSLKGKDEKFGAGLAFLYLGGKHPGGVVEEAAGYVNLFGWDVWEAKNAYLKVVSTWKGWKLWDWVTSPSEWLWTAMNRGSRTWLGAVPLTRSGEMRSREGHER